MARELEARGYERVDFNEQADVYVINSCSVTGKADKKSEQALKKARNQNEQATVVMVGCYAQLQPEKIARIRGVDLILGSNEKFRLPEYLENLHQGSEPEVHTCSPGQERDYFPSWSYGDRTRSFLKVQDGCDYHCSYCTIPMARGNSRNQPVSEILEEARQLAHNQVKEIILTGVNIGDFGKSTGESFLDLIRGLEQVNGIERYRISSIEPNLLNQDIIRAVAESHKFLPHFHIPLQSGCDEILGLMRRRYKTQLFSDKIATIRRIIPEAFIGVDLIVGFPGEDEERFTKTFEFLQGLDVSYYHAFSFSPRPNTPAWEMKQQVPQHIIKERSHQVQQLAEKKKHAFYAAHLNQTRPVLFEGSEKEGKAFGFTDNYIRVETETSESLQGRIRQVRLDEMNDRGNIEGRIV